MATQDRILGGDLETLGLQATLKMLSLGGKTGQLIVTKVSDRADASLLREELQVFLNAGNITALNVAPEPQIDYLDILRLMRCLHRRETEDLRSYTGGQLFPVLHALKERGLISAAEMQQRIEFAIIQEIARALRWEHGSFEFLNNVRIADATLTPLSVDHVLLEAIRMTDEWNKGTALNLDRTSKPKWVSDFAGDLTALSLSSDLRNTVMIANGQHTIAAIAFAMLLPEARVAQYVEQLVSLGLVEVVDDVLERHMDRSLINALTVSQGQLRQEGRQSPEQRLRSLIDVMATCCNKLIAHHITYARALRGRQVPHPELVQFVDSVFLPVIRRAQADYPVIETITFTDGQILYRTLLEDLHKIVKGEQLEIYYWESALAFQRLMNEIYKLIISDELGSGQASRRFYDIWETFAQEVASEFERLHARRQPPARRGPPPNT